MNATMAQEIDKLINTTSKNSLLVNLYAGPGAGKSTTCAGVYTELKLNGIDCEMAREYAKDKVWEQNKKVFENQLYILGKQYYRIKMLQGQVDVIITDSPLLFSLIYGDPNDHAFAEIVMHKYKEFNNLDYFITRQKAYNPNGRHQTEIEARALDTKIFTMLDECKADYRVVPGSRDGIDMITNDIIAILRGA